MSKNIELLSKKALHAGEMKLRCDVITLQDNITTWTYYDTPIITIDWTKKTIKVNNGGFETTSTKTRINSVIEILTDKSIIQRSFKWFIKDEAGKVEPFSNNTILKIGVFNG